MKALFSLTAIAVLALAAFTGCNNSNESPDQKVIMSATVQGVEGTAKVLYLGDEVATYDFTDGEPFTMQWEAEAAAYYQVYLNNKIGFQVYLAPGDSLHTATSMGDMGPNYMASGSKAAENNYLWQKEERLEELGFNTYPGLWVLTTDDFFHRKDSMILALRETYSTIAQLRGVDRTFLANEDTYFQYQKLFLDYIYPSYHAYFAGTNRDSIQGFPTERIEEEVAKIDVQDMALLGLKPVKSLLEFRLQEWMRTKMAADSTFAPNPDDYALASFMAVDSIVRHDGVRNHMKYELVKEEIEYGGPVKGRALYDKFAAGNPGAKHMESLDALLAKWEPMAPGTDVPDFAFQVATGEEVTLSSLRGKLVYIDIWATWCGPCIMEHPYWETLKTEYADAPVTFLAVSIDNTPDLWRKMLVDKKMEGVHWYAPGAWQSDLAKHFMVKAIPRFLLLDANGKVVDPAAPRPSGDIRPVLDQQLAAIGAAAL